MTLPLRGSRLLICRVRTPAYIAAGHHIWWSFPYPPPGDAVGSLQLGPNSLQLVPNLPLSSDIKIDSKFLHILGKIVSQTLLFKSMTDRQRETKLNVFGSPSGVRSPSPTKVHGIFKFGILWWRHLAA